MSLGCQNQRLDGGSRALFPSSVPLLSHEVSHRPKSGTVPVLSHSLSLFYRENGTGRGKLTFFQRWQEVT